MEANEISLIEQYVIDVVREKRTEKGMSQRDLAYELEVNNSFIAAAESRKERAKYNLNHINALAKIFECSPRDFLPEQSL